MCTSLCIVFKSCIIPLPIIFALILPAKLSSGPNAVSASKPQEPRGKCPGYWTRLSLRRVAGPGELFVSSNSAHSLHGVASYCHRYRASARLIQQTVVEDCAFHDSATPPTCLRRRNAAVHVQDSPRATRARHGLQSHSEKPRSRTSPSDPPALLLSFCLAQRPHIALPDPTHSLRWHSQTDRPQSSGQNPPPPTIPGPSAHPPRVPRLPSNADSQLQPGRYLPGVIWYAHRRAGHARNIWRTTSGVVVQRSQGPLYA
ncbi:hypothetical protein EIP86_000197 [Pleurotus ostreatoroseus]|nr:hypothetical protein EIP86_000197 [Pleurotus ostreatoroseus]